MRRHPLKKLLAYALGLTVLGCVWFYFAPSSLGGSRNYVVTHGISMEPRFHTGDLAIVRSQHTYHVGEIVAYYNKMLHVVALHRIVGREGDRYLFKGDNNNFVDPEHPRASQLIGALWIHIHGGGKILQSFGSPARAGLLIAIGMLLLTGGVFARRRRRRGRERRAGTATPRAPRTLPLNPSGALPRNPSGSVLAVLAGAIFVSLPFLLLALFAFTRAPATRHAVQIPYTQSGTLSYSANPAPDPVYPEGNVKSGEPLFTQLVNDVNLRFDYKFATKARHALTSKGSFQLLLSENDGWHRTLQLGSPTYFKGDHATITSTLSLGSLLALAHSIEAATHVQSGYAFAVVPTVVTSGNVGGVPVHATFAPMIQFSVDDDEVSLQGGESSRAALGDSAKSTPALTPSTPGSAAGEQSQPQSLSLGPWRMSVSTARTVALIAIGMILAATLALLALIKPLLALITPRRDEAASIRARYRGMIVPVAHITPLRGVPVIDVADMDALARIADHYDRSILHETTGAGDTFWVADESGQFRYTIGAPAASTNGASAVPASTEEWVAKSPSADGQATAPRPHNGQAPTSQPANSQATAPQPDNAHAPTAQPADGPAVAPHKPNDQVAASPSANSPAVASRAANSQGAAPQPAGDQIAKPANQVSDTDAATPTPTDSERVVAPAWAGGDQAVPAWTETGQLTATTATDDHLDPTLIWTANEQISTPERAQGDVGPTPAFTGSGNGDTPAPAWSDANPMPATAAFDNGATPAPASSDVGPVFAGGSPEIDEASSADWSWSGQIQTSEWSDSGQVSAPGWDQATNEGTIEEHAAESPSRAGFVGELEHPGPFAAPQWQPMPEQAAAASSSDGGWVPLADQAWGSDPDTLVHERTGWQTKDAADAGLTPAGASVASFTGLEWTANS